MIVLISLLVWLAVDAVKSVTRMPITIGASVPIDSGLGNLYHQGLEWLDAFVAAVHTINEDTAYSVELKYDLGTTVADTGYDVDFEDIANQDIAKAAYAAKNRDSKLCQQARTKLCENSDVVAFAGGYRSSRSIGTSKCCAIDANLAQVSFASTSKTLSDKETFPHFFRTVPNDSYQAKGLVALLEKFGFDKVGMIYTDDAYAGMMALAFKKLWLERGHKFSPPLNKDDAKKDIFFHVDRAKEWDSDKGKSNARVAVDRIAEEGESAVIMCFLIPSDMDPIMNAFANKKMTGQGWTYIGPGGIISNLHKSPHLEDAYQGVVATSSKMGERDTLLYKTFIRKWEALSDDLKFSDITRPYPWKGSKNDWASLFSAQMYDAVAAIAKAASNWYDAESCSYDPEKPTECVINRAQMIQSLDGSPKKVEFEAIGNTLDCSQSSGLAGKRCFSFDKEHGGRDGPITFEISNAQGSSWVDVGDFTAEGKILLDEQVMIEWPGGLTTMPLETRPKEKAATTIKSEKMPAWVVPVLAIFGVVLIGLVVGVCYIVKREKRGQPLFVHDPEL